MEALVAPMAETLAAEGRPRASGTLLAWAQCATVPSDPEDFVLAFMAAIADPEPELAEFIGRTDALVRAELVVAVAHLARSVSRPPALAAPSALSGRRAVRRLRDSAELRP